MSLINLNAFEVLKLFNSNKISTVEYVSELISHIKLREPNVEAWAFLNEDLVKFKNEFAPLIDENDIKTVNMNKTDENFNGTFLNEESKKLIQNFYKKDLVKIVYSLNLDLFFS